MIQYITFLRGINAGGRNIIKMDDLTKLFVSIGFANVKTLIQSGNVVFDSTEPDISTIRYLIEEKLNSWFGKKVETILRTQKDIYQIVENDAFANIHQNESVKYYITFFQEKPTKPYKIPMISEKDGLDIFSITDSEAYIISRKVKGMFGFPNNYIEKQLGVIATTRNWNTVCKLIK